ncbi:MAG: hypothetical protein AVDCRST_MAG75-2720 [uncultured Propionibacteriaceae bacterium]|uniref:Glycosyl transferase family 28 C-terminal domain-containing protein n=1 Tax=uncultured Propionibacteriaceae bacterium TaxID=257457 RepID=A0A6J4PGT5_9ACTN|nr:MAG: hypothetical protein AVDCRST_MAG75-2720 [uncultured Propionibacteriaceae bacterium]
MAEASVVITHAGHGSVLKSLAAGVPLVCVPMGRDQKDNTVTRAAARGRRTAQSGGPPPQITAGLSRVIEQPSYAEAARRFADVLAYEAATRPNAADEAEALLTLK